MTTLAHLGPRLDPDQQDSEPVAIKTWSLLTELNGWNEAVCTFRVQHLRDHVELTLLVFVNPRNLMIQRASAMLKNGDSISLNLRDYPMPGNVVDLAVTMVRNQFQPQARRTGWAAVLNDKEYRALVGFNARQGKHHSLVSRLITIERVAIVVVLGVVLGLFGWGYVTAAHHVGQILNDTVAHVRTS